MMRVAPKAVRTYTLPAGASATLADHRGVLAVRRVRMAASAAIGLIGRHDRDHLALVRYLEDVVAEHLACSAHLVVHGHVPLVDGDRDAGCARELVQVLARPPRVGSRKQRTSGAASSTAATSAVERRRVGEDVGREREPLAR